MITTMEQVDVKKYSNYIFDCDGVLWHADRAIEGSIQVIESLKNLGKRVVFITNNSSKTRADYQAKLHRLGFPQVEIADITTSASAVAVYCLENNLRKVFVIGQNGILKECAALDIETVTVSASEPSICTEKDFTELQLETGVQAVIVGWDIDFTFRKLCTASLYLQNQAQLIATNPDTTITASNGMQMPGNGCPLSAIKTSAGLEDCIVVGKPNQNLMKQMLAKYYFATEETLMIGDRIDTDIKFGADAGIDALLVLSGCSSLKDVNSSNNIKPTYVAHSISTAFQF